MSDLNSIDTAISSIDEQILSHRSSSALILKVVFVFGVMILLLGSAIYKYQIDNYSYKVESITSNIGIGYGGFRNINPDIPKSLKTKQSPDNSKQLNTNTPLQLKGDDALLQNSLNSGVGGRFSVGGAIGAPPSENILYIFVVLFVVVFGVLMAIYRFHLSEISRSEQYRLGLLRIRIAANNFDKEGFNSEVRVSLTNGAFDYSIGKEKKVESPLPGHPTSDLTTHLINKLIDKLDFKTDDKK